MSEKYVRIMKCDLCGKEERREFSDDGADAVPRYAAPASYPSAAQSSAQGGPLAQGNAGEIKPYCLPTMAELKNGGLYGEKRMLIFSKIDLCDECLCRTVSIGLGIDGRDGYSLLDRGEDEEDCRV